MAFSRTAAASDSRFAFVSADLLSATSIVQPGLQPGCFVVAVVRCRSCTGRRGGDGCSRLFVACYLPASRGRSSPSSSRNHRTALYCRQASSGGVRPTPPRRATFYNKLVTADAGMDSLENANIFLPRSFSEAPMCQTSAPSIIRKRSWLFLQTCTSIGGY